MTSKLAKPQHKNIDQRQQRYRVRKGEDQNQKDVCFRLDHLRIVKRGLSAVNRILNCDSTNDPACLYVSHAMCSCRAGIKSIKAM